MSSTKSSNSDQAIREFSHVVEDGEEGLRLDKMMGVFPGISSRETARRLILQGEVHVNERLGEPSQRMKTGDQVNYRVPPPEEARVPSQQTDLDILFEDKSLIVINKPPGMPMHPGPGHPRDTLVNYLLGHCHDLSGIGGRLRPGIVHRLDMDTSGVVVAAKSDEAHLGLSEQFKARTIHRTYLALLAGSPAASSGVIDLPLDRQKNHRLKRAVREDGKHAVTHWKVLHRWGPFTSVKVKLETGRTHQIRVHMAHQGWPVLGDPLYGKGKHRGLVLDEAVMNALNQFNRQALHATELGFTHPLTGEALSFRRPPPEDMRELETLLASHYPE